MKYEYNTVIKWLRSAVVLLTFTRGDNIERVMRCTLLPDRLPFAYRNVLPADNEEATATISVGDVDVASWRTFQLENVISIASVE